MISSKTMDKTYLLDEARDYLNDFDLGMGRPLAIQPTTMHNNDYVCVHSGREHGNMIILLCFSIL